MTEYYLSISKINCAFGTSISGIYTFSLAGNIIVCTPSQGSNREKYSRNKQHQRLKCQLWREINTFPSISSLIGRVFPIFRRKMDGHNPCETDIKVLISAMTFPLQLEQYISIIGKTNISNPNIGKNEIWDKQKRKNENVHAVSLVVRIVISLVHSFIVHDCIDFSC